MDTDLLIEQSQFIGAIEPFNQLSPEALERLVRGFNIEYVREGTALNQVIDNQLLAIKKGAIAYSTPSGQLLNQYHEGELCSVFIAPDATFEIEATAIEDCLLYTIGANELFHRCEGTPQIKEFFSQSAAEKLQKRLQQRQQDALLSASLLHPKVSEHFSQPAASIDCQASIKDTAKQMTDSGHSSLIVTQQGQAVGIVTDKDIRSKCVAKGLSFDAKVFDIMAAPLIAIDKNSALQDALLSMITAGIHHLPVQEDGQVVGMISATDIMQSEKQNATSLIRLIQKANSVEELAAISANLPSLQSKLTQLSHHSGYVAKNISNISKALTIRLIKLSQQKLGPEPVPFAWLAAGSLARDEQLAFSDQDNAIIYADAADESAQRYFAKLAEQVCDGLNACGFVYCPGDIMATNPNWRLRQSQWARLFSDWIEQPTPKALLNTTVFFDLATIYGDASLLDEVRQGMLTQTQKNSLFIAQLSKNALNTRPPLGFFRDFVLTTEGDNQSVLDLKKSALSLIVDLARIYALSQGIDAVNTEQRIQLAMATPAITKSSGQSALDALAFLSLLRLEHQATQINQGQPVTNFLSPKSLSALERSHLKQALKVIQTLQDSRVVTY